MHRIDSIEVEGFWDLHNFKVRVNPDVTFFIGVNGTGKTTFINLVAATLLSDFATLDKTPFKKIKITLNSIGASKKPYILVQKRFRGNSAFPMIDYEVKDGRSAKPHRFSLDDFQEQFLLRSNIVREYRRDAYGVSRRNLREHLGKSILPKIQELVQVNWLSIHRASPTVRGEERNYESSIDKKIEQLNFEMVKYFSSLAKSRDEEVRRFQEFVFLSLLEIPNERGPIASLNQKHLNASMDDLAQIFAELHIPESKTKEPIAKYSKKVNELASALHDSNNRMTIEQLILMFGNSRIDAVVRLWRDLQMKSKEIFAPRDKFLNTLNEMLQGKRAEVGESNEIGFRTKNDQSLTPMMLSSGEKQLYILLGEVLLQRSQPYVFVADEPELSLHVKWQERLISSMRQLNSSSQILAATHSPDIVGALHHSAIDMESLLK